MKGHLPLNLLITLALFLSACSPGALSIGEGTPGELAIAHPTALAATPTGREFTPGGPAIAHPTALASTPTGPAIAHPTALAGTPEVGFPTAIAPPPGDMQPVFPADLPVVNDRLVESEDKVYANGEVENRSQGNIQFVKITARLFDPGGSQVAENFTFGYPAITAPGKRAAFSVVLDRPIAYQSYELLVEARTTSQPPFTGLELVDEFSESDDMGYAHIYGMVENTGETTLEHPSIIAVLYDAEGKVTNVSTTPPSTAEQMLAAGKHAPFNLLPYPFGTEFSSYRLILEGTPTTKSPPPELEILEIEKVGDRLVGFARFPGPGSVTVYGITVVFFDAKDKMFGYAVGITHPQDLAAGDSAPWEVVMIPLDYARYEVYASYSLK